jgi:hypothetical protein
MVLKRTLTRKSTLGFGKHKDKTIQFMLDLRKHVDLLSVYYKITAIDFTPDILDELKVTEDLRIEKPSTDYEKYKIMLLKYPRGARNKELEKMLPQTKAFKKSYLQRMNHGK